MRRLPFTEPADAAEALKFSVAIIGSNGIVLVPTETFYGLAATHAVYRKGNGRRPRTGFGPVLPHDPGTGNGANGG